MPRGDRTGPLGEGSMTGRRQGYCAGADQPGFTAGAGRAFGRGLGLRGRGHGFFWFRRDANLPESTRPDDLSGIRADIESLKNSIASILDRLKDK